MAQDQSEQVVIRLASTSLQEMENDVEASEKKGNTQVDRLSSLPPELLNEIFDLAYPVGYPSTGPLSKHLLHYHLVGLYSRIKLTKESTVSRLIEKITSQPSLGELVRVLRIEIADSESGSARLERTRKCRRFLQKLTKLEELDLGKTVLLGDLYSCLDPASLDTSLLAQEEDRAPFSFQSSLRRLHLAGIERKTPENPLLLTQSFPNLVSLHFSEYNYPYGPLDLADYAPLKHLSQLTIVGAYADDSAIASFCLLCPSLRALKLEATHPDYENLLKSLPLHIVNLELLPDGPTTPVDSFLPPFNQLRSLSLGCQLYSPNLLSNISGLLHLERLVLGEGFTTVSDLLPFVSASTRPPSLLELELNLFRVAIGGRFDPQEHKEDVPEYMRDGDLVDDNWSLIGLSFGVTRGLTIEQIEAVIGMAREEGIKVRGTILKALEVAKAYLLEVANVAIWHCWRGKSFQYMVLMKELFTPRCHRLPSIDFDFFDSLDPSKLNLVRTELPEEGWFSLSLEN
ncbi:hypothetical protein JCM3765_004747 [Sporobolomyces pararoseus]